MHIFTIPLPEPTDFSQLVTRIRQSSHGAFYRHKEGRIGRVLRLYNEMRFVELGIDPLDCKAFEVRIYNGLPSEEEVVRKQVTHLFSLDANFHEFYRHAKHDHKLSGLVSRLSGARMIRDSGIFSSVISSIISQQVNLKFAAELKHRLWSLAGESMTVDGDEFFADPNPSAIAKLNYDQLRVLQYSTRKAEYVIDFARGVESGEVDLVALSALEDEEFILRLSKYRGLGRWTAECVLLFGLGRQDLLPANDVGLQKAVSNLWGLDCRITEKELRARTSDWSPWSSWYTYYLWLSLAQP